SDWSSDVCSSDLLIAQASAVQAGRLGERVGLPSRYGGERPLEGVDLRERIDLLRRASRRAAGADSRIKWVSASIGDQRSQVTIAASDGTFVSDDRPRLRMHALVNPGHGDRLERGYAGGGGRT